MAKERSLNDLYRIRNYVGDRLFNGTAKHNGLSYQVREIACKGIENIEKSDKYKWADEIFANMQRRGATKEQLTAFMIREENRKYPANIYLS